MFTVIVTRLPRPHGGHSLVASLGYSGRVKTPDAAIAAMIARPWGLYGIVRGQAGVTVEVYHVRRRDIRRMQSGRARGWPWWERPPAFSFVV